MMAVAVARILHLFHNSPHSRSHSHSHSSSKLNQEVRQKVVAQQLSTKRHHKLRVCFAKRQDNFCPSWLEWLSGRVFDACVSASGNLNSKPCPCISNAATANPAATTSTTTIIISIDLIKRRAVLSLSTREHSLLSCPAVNKRVESAYVACCEPTVLS